MITDLYVRHIAIRLNRVSEWFAQLYREKEHAPRSVLDVVVTIGCYAGRTKPYLALELFDKILANTEAESNSDFVELKTIFEPLKRLEECELVLHGYSNSTVLD